MPPKPVLDHICQALLPALMKRSKKVPAVSIGYKDFGRDDIVFCGVAGFEQALNLFWGILVHSMGAGHHDFFESRPSQDFNPCAPGFFSHGARRQFSSAYALLQQAEALLAPGDHDFLREVLAFYYCTKNPDECDGASLAQIIRLAQASNQYLTNTFHEVTAFLKTGLGSHYTVVPDDAGGAYLTRGATFQVRTIVKKRSGFIDFLDEIGPAQLEDDTGNSRLFFRGQSTLAYSYAPSLYRRAGWRENESELLFDVISKKPEVFTDCPTTFEKLTKVQHYSLPTRLLDFSSNPMVGLKFACGVKEDAVDGELMIVKIPRPALKRFGSNRVCILSTLATFTHENQEQLFYWAVLSYVIDLAGLNADSRVLQSTLATAEQTLHALFGKPVALKAASVQALYRQLKKQIRFGHDMLRIDALEAKNGNKLYGPGSNIIDRFVNKLQQEKSGFRNNIRAQDLFYPRFVYPKQNNERIKKQDGFFLLFGLGTNPSNDLLTLMRDEDGVVTLYVVPAKEDNKQALNAFLDSIGYSSYNLFPEIASLATFVKNSY